MLSTRDLGKESLEQKHLPAVWPADVSCVPVNLSHRQTPRKRKRKSQPIIGWRIFLSCFFLCLSGGRDLIIREAIESLRAIDSHAGPASDRTFVRRWSDTRMGTLVPAPSVPITSQTKLQTRQGLNSDRRSIQSVCLSVVYCPWEVINLMKPIKTEIQWLGKEPRICPE